MGTFLAVTTVLLMIIISGRLIKTMAYAAAGEMSIQVVLMALLLRLPSFLQIIIPMSLFIAVLIGYGRMYAESEMTVRSEEHTSELQSRPHLVCRLLLEKKNKKRK